MNRSDRDLYRQLLEFPLDDPYSTLRFSYRLARENGWSINYTQRLVHEYRRFLFLAAVAGHTVTPSDQVDQAWHLHLTYTESYWNELCGQILKRPLHHGPTKGGPTEGVKYHELYEKTLESYRTVFEEEPPADIWPAAEIRFGTDLCFQRVNTQRYWLFPKPGYLLAKANRRSHPQFAAVAVGVFGMGVTSPLDLPGPEFLALFSIAFVISIVIALGLRFLLRPEWGDREAGDEAPAVDTYETAYLAGGASRVTEAAIATLVEMGVVRPAKVGSMTRLATKRPIPESAHEVETAVYASLVAAAGDVTGNRYKKFLSSTISKLEQQLQRKGLVESSRSFAAARWTSILAMAPVLVFGVAKLFVGLSRDRPVGFLVLGVLATLVTIVWLALHRPRCTRAGAEWYRNLTRERNVNGRQTALREPSQPELDTSLAHTVALGGLAAGFGASEPITDAFTGKKKSASAGGWFGGSGGCAGAGFGAGGCSGGGCGGGGCGGGCGGCGA